MDLEEERRFVTSAVWSRGARLASVTLVLWLCASCSTERIDLSVDVRTDYVAGRDFAMVVTDLGAPSFAMGGEVRTSSMPADGAEDFLRGERVAELTDVPSGTVSVRVRLMNGAGAVVAQRIVALELEHSYAATVLITSNCAGVSCPAPAGAPLLSECLDGACVDPRCTPATPKYCPPACEANGDCSTRVGCAATVCIEGTCFCSGPPRADAGPTPDSGSVLDASAVVDASITCDCVPGASESEMMPCGNCDSGARTRTRTCEASCTFGPWSDWSACSGGGACAPGATRGCPNGDSCGNQVCNGSCAWGGCVRRAGAQCLRIGPGHTTEGTNYRCCGADQWQYCLAGCVWSTVCSSCAPTNCPDC